MVWCGVMLCGVVWCGVVWYNVVWCGVVGCGVVWCGVVFTSTKTFRLLQNKLFEFEIKFPFKRKACQVYRVKYGRGRIW